MRSFLAIALAGVMVATVFAAGGCGQPSSRANVSSAHAMIPRATTLGPVAPKSGRARPLVVVVADNAGTETTDFVVPYGVLKESGVADVVTVSTDPGAVTLIPALRIRTDMTMAQFDSATPAGADILIVPAVKRNDSPALLRWVRAQHEKGAKVVAVCEGAWVIANAGLLEGRSATTHWLALEPMADGFPGTTWIRDRRWVIDRDVMTTAGVSAAIPASLALIESIAGRPQAERTARALGAPAWTVEHDTSAFARTPRLVAVAIANWLAWWRHETVEVPVEEGFDEIAIALTADAWSRTFRSHALATHSSGAVRSRRGLLLEAAVAASEGRPTPAEVPGRKSLALAETLDDIASRYGAATADIVAAGLEQRRGRAARSD